MGNGNEQMQVEFHGKANAVYYSISHGFEIAVANVSRTKDEYKFQQLKKHYASMLEQELEVIAKTVLASFKKEKQLNEVDLMFKRFIKEYLHRFIQKVNDL